MSRDTQSRGGSTLLWALCLAVALGGSPIAIHGQTIQLVEDQILLEGRIGVALDELVRGVRISVDGATDGARLNVVAEDLTEADSVRFIDRRRVTLQNVPQMYDGEFNVGMGVGGIDAPGTYTGEFELHLVDSNDTIVAADTGQLTVVVHPRADVTVLVPEDGFQQANCTNFFTCWMARVLVHRFIDRDILRVYVPRSFQDTLLLEEARLVLVGALSGEARELDAVTLDSMPLPPGGATVELPLARGTLDPDSYTAHLSVTVVDLARPLDSEFRMDVRAGPGWASLLLVLGIVLSRWFVEINQAPERFKDGALGVEKTRVWLRLSGFKWYDTAPDPGTRLLAWLTGVPWSHDRPLEGHLRRVAFVLVFGAALLEGLGEFFVDASTFGDTLLVDYAAIFFWPFAAEVVTRGLANLKWPRPFRVSLVPSAAVANVGSELELRVGATGGPNGSLGWSCASSDAAVATVAQTQKGCLVTCVGAGSATIIAQATKGSAESTATTQLMVRA